MPKPLVLVVALALTLAACTGGAGADTTTSSSTTTTTRATTTTTRATTTTTVDARPTSPVNGLPVDDEQALARRVLAVKIDNHPNARPQSGIQQADGVMEVRVEGGLTRFIALFHHSDSDYVGPIRSARPTDAKLVAPLGATLVISGGQEWVRAGIVALGVPYVSDTRPGMFRWFKSSGQPVAKGEPLGVICDPYGTNEWPVLASHSGHLIGHNNATIVNIGEALFHIGFSNQ
jgi:hypothetical protein